MARFAHASLPLVALVALLWAPRVAAQATPAAESTRNARVPAGEAASVPITWQWARFSPFEYVLTSTAAAGAFAIQLAVERSEGASWSGPILFDNSTRELLVFDSDAGRHAADVASTILRTSLVTYSLADALVLSWITSRNLDVATQLLLLDLQSFAVTTLLTQGTKHVIARERASDRRCHLSRSGDVPCDQGTAHESFFSGHASLAFTAAGLICARHRAIPLYGGGVWDALACGTSLAAAAATGLLRVSTDAHYLSDVVVGAGVGLASGYLLPTLLHFERPRAQSPLLIGALWSSGPLLIAGGRF